MQENWLEIITAFDQNQAFVLVTIVATKGSTYRKKGTLMLIDRQGQCTGLLSGGCLEADIALHAKQVFSDNKSKSVHYDLQSDEMLLWGLGLGCDGEITILLQPINPENAYLGFSSLLQTIKARESGYFYQIIDDATTGDGGFIKSAISQSHGQEISTLLLRKYPDNKTSLIIPVTPPLSMLICGAGPDVVPVVNIANELGWQVTLWDHRAHYLNQAVFNSCHQTKITRAKQTDLNDYSPFDIALVMTHNLETDAQYLAQLLTTSLGYIGLLGPKKRKEKLLARCQDNLVDSKDFVNRVHGPMGLNLGGRSPQAIALSVAAQIQQYHSLQYDLPCYQPWHLAW